MKPLLVLIGAFLTVLLIVKFTKGNFEIKFSARFAMGVMLLFTALGHFLFSKGMVQMIPSFIPFKLFLVYSTGVLEILIAIALFTSFQTSLMGLILLIFFLLILPANIYAAYHGVNYQTGAMDGPSLSYLIFRIPLQFLFVLWTFYFIYKS